LTLLIFRNSGTWRSNRHRYNVPIYTQSFLRTANGMRQVAQVPCLQPCYNEPAL